MDAMNSEVLMGRQLEATVLTKAAAMLEEIKQNWDAPDAQELLGDVLTYNERLWTVFQAELVDNTHPMPPQIKNNILILGDFVGRYTRKLGPQPAPDKLDVLININRNIAAGLHTA